MAYLSKSTILKAYEVLSSIDEDKKQGLTQKVSALKYGTALDMYFKQYHKKCDLKVTSNKDLFSNYVGTIVGINYQQATKDFYTNVASSGRDYDCGSNFFSQSSVKDSKTNPTDTFLYPKRSGWQPVMDVKNQELIYKEEYIRNYIPFYLNSPLLRLSYAVWILRYQQIDSTSLDSLYKTANKLLTEEYCNVLLLKDIEEHDLSFIELSDDLPVITKSDLLNLFSPNTIPNHFIPLSHQQIYYGAPGTGKSNAIKRQVDEKGLPYVRTTFHPDSDYSTFVGAYKPTMVKRVRYGLNQKETVVMKDPDNGNEPLKEQRIEYKFVKQAFLKAYVNAWKLYRDTSKDGNEARPQFLVIEEINRGNCAQIFGDLFQLLDRKKGFSEYPIEADEDVCKSFLNKDSDDDPCFGENGLQLSDEQKEYINSLYDKPGFPSQNVAQRICEGKVLVLPSNLYIWATMNTSDQSLFPIDSAFKRRWEWVYQPIDTKKEVWYIKVGGNYYSWTSFLDKVNDELLTDETAEDKHLGFYFCKATEKREGTENEPNVITSQTFVGKVLFYLWNDVFKVYGIPSSIGSSKEWPYRKFYQTNGEVDEEKVVELMEKLQIEACAF